MLPCSRRCATLLSIYGAATYAAAVFAYAARRIFMPPPRICYAICAAVADGRIRHMLLRMRSEPHTRRAQGFANTTRHTLAATNRRRQHTLL